MIDVPGLGPGPYSRYLHWARAGRRAMQGIRAANAGVFRCQPDGSGPDQLGRGDAYGMEFTIKILFPKLQNFLKHRKAWCHVVILPNVILQEVWKIRTTVSNFGGRQAVALELYGERHDSVLHSCLGFAETLSATYPPRRAFSNCHPSWRESSIIIVLLQHISSLSVRVLLMC